MKLLVTGGSGFIGSNFIKRIIRRGHQVVNLDKLTYAGNPENLRDVENHRNYKFVPGDITDRRLVENISGDGIDTVINFAAESHVDKSISDPSVFIRTNVQGTQVLLDTVLKRPARFIQVSTDEVYGTLGPSGHFTEETPLSPNNPYSASKAAADLLAMSYHKTYGLPVTITRCSNNYGPLQYPEKLIPLAITNALRDIPIPIYGDGLYVRDWVHVEDHCRAIEQVMLCEEAAGEVFNIGGGSEKTNLEIIGEILGLLGKPLSLLRFVKDRPGHDRRYAMDYAKIAGRLGWQPEVDLSAGLARTVDWYVRNTGWWEPLKAALAGGGSQKPEVRSQNEYSSSFKPIARP